MTGLSRRFFDECLRISSGISVAILVFGAAASAQVSAPLRSKAVRADALVAKADSGPVRVILTLSGNTATTSSLSSTSASTMAPAGGSGLGPLGDGQRATVEQTRVVANHITTGIRARSNPRLIVNSRYMAATVTRSELEALAADPDVVSIHEDGRSKPVLTQSVPLIGMNSAYLFGASGANTTVAILDTGVRYDHVFLTPRVTGATCFSTNSAPDYASYCPNGQSTQIGGNAGTYCPDVAQGCEHGSHVAGIAAGYQASGSPPNGVAPSAEIFSSQIFTKVVGPPVDLTAFDSDLLASLNDLLTRVNNNDFAAKPLVAINMSLGDSEALFTGDCDSDARTIPFKSVIDALRAKNVATVIASGNDGETDRTSFPGCISTAVTVSSTTKSDGVSGFSNVSTIVDLFAPGSSITSSVPDSTTSFAVLSGTSMATPHVTGAWSAIRSVCPATTVSQIEASLKSTGRPIVDINWTRPRIRLETELQIESVMRLADFDGNGKADILWRSDAGDVGLWLMDGTTPVTFAGLGTVDRDWKIVAAADVNGDGKADLVWRQRSTGAIAIWFMNGGTISSTAVIGVVDISWHIIAAADFNGDGKADILWRKSDGTLAQWFMNGATLVSSVSLGLIDPAWKIAGVADFDGDGKADLLWRASSGELGVWLMDGGAVLGQAGFGVVPFDWRIVGVGDFNGDLKSDILWRRDDGFTALWFMNGLSMSSSATVGSIGASWHVAGAGDLNNDAKADILWRNDDGALGAWLMNGATLVSSAGSGTVGTDWRIVGGEHNYGDLVGSGLCD